MRSRRGPPSERGGFGLQAPGRPERDNRELKRKVIRTSKKGVLYVDFKNCESLRRMMTNNGKIGSRRRTSASAMEQRLIAQAVKRARFMGLLPFVEATA